MPDLHPFATRLGLRHPLIQAPMAGVATPALAAAVSNAGALGSLGIGASTLDQARQMIAATQALTPAAFNVNVFCHAPAQRDAAREAAWLQHLAPLFQRHGASPPQALNEIYPSFVGDEQALAMLLQLRPAVVSFHFGLPPHEHIAALKAARCVTLATATNVDEAALIERAGVDAIVAQGIEAGGHRGMFNPAATDERHSTAVLLRLLQRHTGLPLVAAGGVMDGAGIQAMLDLGAAAVQLGTAFVLCPESAASAAYRAQLQSADAAHTRLTAVLSGRPARGLVNRLIQHGEAAGSPPPADYPVAYDAAKRLHAAAAAQGDAGCAAHWAGQGAPLARALPAAQLVQALVDERRQAQRLSSAPAAGAASGRSGA